MELESPYLNRNYEDKIKGTITFKGNGGKVELSLEEPQVKKILAVCAERLIEQAQEAANNLTGAVIEAAEQAQLESK